jgi:hypothetical protein
MYPFFTGMHIEGNPAAGGTPGNLPATSTAGAGARRERLQGVRGVAVRRRWRAAVPVRQRRGVGPHVERAAPLGWTSADAAGSPSLPVS